MTEEWRPVPGFAGYEVSDLGRVRSWRCKGRHVGKTRKTPAMRKPTIGEHGYARVNLATEGRKKKIRHVHHLVLEAFVGQKPVGHECAHGDGNTLNNSLDNLRWASKVDNASDKVRHGTKLMGEAVKNAKLTEQAVREIRRTKGTSRIMADRFGVSRVLVCQIRRGKIWRHVV